MRGRTRTSVVFAVTAAVVIPGVSAGAEGITPLKGQRAAVALDATGGEGASALASGAAQGGETRAPARPPLARHDSVVATSTTPAVVGRDKAVVAGGDRVATAAASNATSGTDASVHEEGPKDDTEGGPLAEVGGRSKPGVVVTAQNPGTAPASDLRITLSAHSAKSSVSDPSCGPQDQNLRCGASLVLAIKEHAGFSVSGFIPHRVAVGGEGGGGDDGGHAEMSSVTMPAAGVLRAQVNGVAFVTDPGDTGVAVGTQVQIKMQLVDNGKASYGDQIILTVNRFVSGSDKPPLFGPLAETIQQVQIHELGPSSTSAAR